MRGRTVPVIVAPPLDSDPSQDVDERYFVEHPHATEYERAALPGEAPEPMPPGTRVWVKRVGEYVRVRGFCPPKVEVN
jgi:hypothetical protein